MSSKESRKVYFQQAFAILETQGKEWVTLSEVGELAAAQDATYLRRREWFCNLLATLGCRREVIQDGLSYPPFAAISNLITDMQNEGLIQKRTPDADSLDRPTYRLTPQQHFDCI